MKTKILILFIFIAFLLSCSSSFNIKPSKVELSKYGRNIAVLEFVDLRKSSIKKKYPLDTRSIQELIISGLAQRDFNVVERKNLEVLLKEIQLQLSGVIRPEDAVQVGKMTGASLVIYGSILQFERTIYPKVKFRLILKIVSVENGSVVASVKITATKSNWFYPLELLDDTLNEAIEKIVSALK